MSCTGSHLSLEEHSDGETTICSIPVRMKGPDEIIPIDLDLSNDYRTALTRIVKVISSLIILSLFHTCHSRISKQNIAYTNSPRHILSPNPFCFSSTHFLLIKYN